MSYRAILIFYNGTLMFGNETLMSLDYVLTDENVILISMLGLLRLGLAL
ncbi:hypothetical protein [Sphingobacterium griseoflavum]|nr:hypothetical protein [Sphingobacterium griseoflavum]